jgi:hypothetical protein
VKVERYRMHARLEPPLTQEQSSRSWPRVSQNVTVMLAAFSLALVNRRLQRFESED